MYKKMNATICTGLLTVFTTTTLTIHAEQWDWHHQLKNQPNQYWEMYKGKPIIQRTDKHKTIYYHINIEKSSPYYRAWSNAVKRWDHLGVIKLVAASDGKATIHLGGKYNKHLAIRMHNHELNNDLNGSAGMSYYNYAQSNDQHKAYFTNANSYISTHAGYNGNMHYYTDIATHELGHDLGFAHNNHEINGKYSVMSANHNSQTKWAASLGPYERTALKLHY